MATGAVRHIGFVGGSCGRSFMVAISCNSFTMISLVSYRDLNFFVFLAKKSYLLAHKSCYQKAQLSQRGRVMLRVVKNFAKPLVFVAGHWSFKVIRNYTEDVCKVLCTLAYICLSCTVTDILST